LNEGLQYRLGDIRFIGDTGIPEAEVGYQLGRVVRQPLNRP
jgi:hypothetical protein